MGGGGVKIWKPSVVGYGYFLEWPITYTPYSTVLQIICADTLLKLCSIFTSPARVRKNVSNEYNVRKYYL